MKISKIFVDRCILVLLMAFAFIVVSCGNEDEKLRPVKIKVSGVELTQRGNATIFNGILPAEGAEVIFTVEDGMQSGFLSELMVLGNVVNDLKLDEIQQSDAPPYVIYSDEVCVVETVTLNPYMIKLTVNPNCSGFVRDIKLTFGIAYKVSSYTFEQRMK